MLLLLSFSSSSVGITGVLALITAYPLIGFTCGAPLSFSGSLGGSCACLSIYFIFILNLHLSFKLLRHLLHHFLIDFSFGKAGLHSHHFFEHFVLF